MRVSIRSSIKYFKQHEKQFLFITQPQFSSYWHTKIIRYKYNVQKCIKNNALCLYKTLISHSFGIIKPSKHYKMTRLKECAVFSASCWCLKAFNPASPVMTTPDCTPRLLAVNILGCPKCTLVPRCPGEDSLPVGTSCPRPHHHQSTSLANPHSLHR